MLPIWDCPLMEFRLVSGPKFAESGHHSSTLLPMDRSVGDSLLRRGTAVAGHFADPPRSLLRTAFAGKFTPVHWSAPFPRNGNGVSGCHISPQFSRRSSSASQWRHLLEPTPATSAAAETGTRRETCQFTWKMSFKRFFSKRNRMFGAVEQWIMY